MHKVNEIRQWVILQTLYHLFTLYRIDLDSVNKEAQYQSSRQRLVVTIWHGIGFWHEQRDISQIVVQENSP